MKKTTGKSIDPQTVVPARVYRAALNRVNKFRREAGVRPLKKLPHGTPRCARKCPIWHALVPAMNGTGFGVSGIGIQVAMSRNPRDLLGWALITRWGTSKRDQALWRPIDQFIAEFDNEPGLAEIVKMP